MLNFLLKLGTKKMWSMLETGISDPKFQTLLAFMTRSKCSIHDVLSLLKSLHNIVEWSQSYLDQVYFHWIHPKLVVRPHQSPSLAIRFYCFRILRGRFLPINCIFISFVNVGNSGRDAHDRVLNTCCGIMIGIWIMHSGNAATQEIAFSVIFNTY